MKQVIAFLLCVGLASGCLFELENADPGPRGAGGQAGSGGSGGSDERGEAGTCEPCAKDLDCAQADHRCVPLDYNGSRFPDDETGFCLEIASRFSFWPGVEDFDCRTPYVHVLEDRTSLSGHRDDYCGIRESDTSCPAVLALANDQGCPERRDDECPVGGICRDIRVDFEEREWRCTYVCTDRDQCSGPGLFNDCNSFCEG